MTAKKNKKTTPQKVMLNLGCGVQMLKGFINVDTVKPSNADSSFVLGSVDNLPFESDSVDYAIMDNVLEHIRMADIPKVLFEVRRVLKKGGRFVIVVPDFACLARNFIDISKDSFNPVMYHWVAETVYGNQHHEGEFHKAPMSPQYLNYLLLMVGFNKFDMIMCPAGGKLPDFPGIIMAETGMLRNDQIVADVTKT